MADRPPFRRGRVGVQVRLDELQTAPIGIADAMNDPQLFGPAFAGPSWDAWRTVAKALEAKPLQPADLVRFQRCTGRQTPPAVPPREVWMPVGRRGGKDRFVSLVAAALGCLRDWSAVLAPGEAASIVIVAVDRSQARITFKYLEALIATVPALSAMVVRRTREVLELSNGLSIEVATSSWRSIRGRTVVVAILNEVAFLRDETSANPDVALLHAIRPALATVPNALLLGVSSPYSRRGVLWAAYRDHWGRNDDPVLVWSAPSQVMNPSIPDHVIAAAMAEDPAAARAEWLAEFRTDLESYISPEAVSACVISDRRELPRIAGVSYRAFTDPAGGSGGDSMTIAVAHSEQRGSQRVVVLDAIREVPSPFSPDAAVAEFAELLRSYGVTSVRGDRYASEWPRERFAVHGIAYEVADKVKSDLYTAFLPIINSRLVELLDHAKLISQLCALERRTARGGRDSIDHPPHQHDDVVNCVAGVVTATLGPVFNPHAMPLIVDPRPSPWTLDGGFSPGWRDAQPYDPGILYRHR